MPGAAARNTSLAAPVLHKAFPKRLLCALDVPDAGTPATRPLGRLVALHRADGSWDLTDELALALDTNPVQPFPAMVRASP